MLSTRRRNELTRPLARREDSKQHIAHVKTEARSRQRCAEPFRAHLTPGLAAAQGIKQFLHIWEKNKSIRDDVLKWGDEVEYTLIVKDEEDGFYRLQCAAPKMLQALNEGESAAPASAQVVWHPEYSNWQIEGTPAHPYRCYATDLLLVEPNMALRRSIIQKQLAPTQRCVSITSTAVMGLPGFVRPQDPDDDMSVHGPVADSNFLPDSIINPHPRFATLTGNIRARRGAKVDIHMPLFEDEHTAQTPEEAGVDANGTPQPSLEDGIRMDCMGFGMGSCCLQVTLQARDVDEARVLYDQLGVMGPLMLAVTGASPFWRGRLAATDARWNVISQAVDCRTPGERGDAELKEGEQRMPKSRYAGFSTYIAPRRGESQVCPGLGEDTACEPEPEPAAAEPEPEPAAGTPMRPKPLSGTGRCAVAPPEHLAEYDDVDVPINEEAYQTLLDGGIDEVMARHVAWMYSRDPLVIYTEKLEQDATASNDHYENIQSTNWNSVRFKLPPPGSDIGWRVEFRTPELQLTDFENAAFSIFTVLLSRVIIAFNLNLYIPMSKNDANMETAHEEDAVNKQRFYFRKHIIKPDNAVNVELYHSTSPAIRERSIQGEFDRLNFPTGEDHNEYTLMTLDEIINGRASDEEAESFPGILPLVHAYLDLIQCDGATRDVLNCYLDLVRLRASGELVTAAKWMRSFITGHDDYKQDSVITPKMNNDLVDACLAISDGSMVPEELLGRLNRRMRMVLQRLAAEEEEGASPSSTRDGAAGDAEGGDAWDEANRRRWEVGRGSCLRARLTRSSTNTSCCC